MWKLPAVSPYPETAEGFQHSFVKNFPNYQRNKTMVGTISSSSQQVPLDLKDKDLPSFLLCTESINNQKRIFTLNKYGCRILCKN